MAKNKPSQRKRDQKRYEKNNEIRREKDAIKEVEAEKLANDGQLDDAAKIDAFAKMRGWFWADTSIVDKYMSDDLTGPEAVEQLAKPVDAAYSSADFGRAWYKAENVAKNQRQYHSPEKALEMWGPPQDIPEPETEWEESKSTEMLLWNLWYGVLHAAKRISYKDEARHDKLLNLVRLLKARPDPPLPEPMTIPLKREWIWESGTLWSELVMLGPSIAEVSNDVCGCGAGWQWPEQRAWQNLSFFWASLTGSGIYDVRIHGVTAIVDAIDESPSPGYARVGVPPPAELLSHAVTVASLWAIHAGEQVFSEFPKVRDARDIEVVDRILHQRDKELPWLRSRSKFKNRARWETARREFARRRFEYESQNEELSLEVRELAAKAAKAMEPLVKPESVLDHTEKAQAAEQPNATV